MKVKDIMTANPEYLLPTASLSEAAQKMRELNIGFLPVSDPLEDKLIGTITDRDIVISAVADQQDLKTPVKNVMHEGVSYCFEKDEVEEACKKMKAQQIRRLIVLNEDKKLTGVLSLGDIALNGDDSLSGDTLEDISKH